jgi:HPt (histidine-containing phosphotransfer) domain-containing protein
MPVASAPITSRLSGQPGLRPIVRKFAGRLRERLDEVARAEASRDYVAIANFAHWLKGSAGSMGYDDFNEPAAELERAAKAAEGERAGQLIDDLRHMAARVVAPGEESAAA